MNNNLNIHIIHILVGCLLGDAHISKSGYNKPFITIEQLIKHKDYVMHLHNLFNNNGIKTYDIKYYSRKESRYNSINESIYFKTHTSELLYFLADMFISKDNKKVIPSNIKDYLTPATLAYWICDDGN